MPYDVFLSYGHADRTTAEKIARTLETRGLTVFYDRDELAPGQGWIERLETVLASCRAVLVLHGRNELGKWQRSELEVALRRQLDEDSRFLVAAVLLPGCDPPAGFVGNNSVVDMRSESEAAQDLDRLVDRLANSQGPPPSTTPPARPDVICPYRGLRPFREVDEPVFFGRTTYSKRLFEAVHRRSIIALIGGSGSGKSSVVRAGLQPQLRRSPEETSWEIANFSPGESPLHALAAALAPILEPTGTETEWLLEIERLQSYLASTQGGLRKVARRIIGKGGGDSRLLLVVDPWEETYTHGVGHAERDWFTDELIGAAKEQGVVLLLTLRSDFFGRVLESRALADELEGGVVLLGPMSRQEMCEVIELPARRAGMTLESGLVDRIVDELGDEPGSLPLLEFLLTELWGHRNGLQLGHKAYASIHGPEGSVAKYAERVYARSSSNELWSRVFLRLVCPGDGAPDTRRRVGLDSVEPNLRATVEELCEARLLVAESDYASGRVTIEIAHEALIRSWKRLQGWIEDSRNFLVWRGQIAPEIGAWIQAGRRSTVVLSKPRTTEALRWLKRRQADLSDQERAYLAALRKRIFHKRLVAASVLTILLGLIAGSRLRSRHLALRAAERAQAASLLDELDSDGAGFPGSDLQKAFLEELAACPPRVRIDLLDQGLEQSRLHKLRPRLHEVLRAVLGPETDHRDDVLKLLRSRLCDENSTIETRIASVAAVEILAPQWTDEAYLIPAIESIAQGMAQGEYRFYRWNVNSQLPALCSRLSKRSIPETARTLLARVLETEDWSRRSDLLDAYSILAARFSEADALDATSALMHLLLEASGRPTAHGLDQALQSVAERLDEATRSDCAHSFLSAIAAAEQREVRVQLAGYFCAVSQELPDDRIPTNREAAAQMLLEIAARPRDYQGPKLARALLAMATGAGHRGVGAEPTHGECPARLLVRLDLDQSVNADRRPVPGAGAQ